MAVIAVLRRGVVVEHKNAPVVVVAELRASRFGLVYTSMKRSIPHELRARDRRMAEPLRSSRMAVRMALSVAKQWYGIVPS